MRYHPFKLPRTGHHGIVDKRRGGWLYGVICEDEIAAEALARLLNQEFHKWRDEFPSQETAPVIVPHVYRMRDYRVAPDGTKLQGRTFSVSDPPPPQPNGSRRFSLADYAAKAPESERRLIRRLRTEAAAD